VLGLLAFPETCHSEELATKNLHEVLASKGSKEILRSLRSLRMTWIKSQHGLSFKQPIDKGFGVEWGQIFDFFAGTDKADRDTQFLANRENHPAFRRPIQLG
jgi:hypothetical protein